jgi:S-adenosylmethionine:tRNA ribosyltransferase-isomerase
MIPHLHIADYSYDLPDERIAKYPLAQRDASKLLVYKKGEISESVFTELPNLLPKGALLVFNNTKVIPARLIFKRSTGAEIEIFCLEPYEPKDYQLSLSAKDECCWTCIVGNLKRWKEERLQHFFTFKNTIYSLFVNKLKRINDEVVVKFSWSCPKLSFAEVIEICGALPIPPYLNRSTEQSDYERYQTIYSKYRGSVAAPTAGLHFSSSVLSRLKNRHVRTAEVTLHVGAGTFKPVKTNTIGEHEMHTEHFTVSLETLEQLLMNVGKIVAVGTTSVRTLESIYWLGYNLLKNSTLESAVSQWIPYQNSDDVPVSTALEKLISYLKNNNLKQISAGTQILIAPPYQFKLVQGMLTNFHQPQSTLLLLVSAMVGNRWRDIYSYALEHDFRFLSYGDSSLIMDNE